MSGPLWRAAREADHARVLDLIGEYFHHDHIPYDRAAIAAPLAELLRTPSLGRVLVLEGNEGDVEGGRTGCASGPQPDGGPGVSAKPTPRGKTISGYAIATRSYDLEFGGHLAIVTDVFIEPAGRRRGAGRGALEAIEAWARAEGLKALELTPETDNLPARALYGSAGFKEHTRLAMTKRL